MTTDAAIAPPRAPATARGAGLDVEQTVQQVVRRIAEAPVSGEPAPNIYLEDVFPPAVYQAMLQALPPDDALDFLDHPDAYADDGRQTRKLLDLTPATVARLPAADRALWSDLTAVFTHPTLQQAVVDKFRPTLAERFPDGIPELVTVPLFYRDFPGYRIGIHPDAVSKVATLQFFLPADHSQRHIGTTFHRRRDDGGFDDLKTLAFQPNSGYAFVRTDGSWHSVKELGASEPIRNSIALTFYLRGQEYVSPDRPPRLQAEIESLGIGEIGQVQTPAGPLRYGVSGGGFRFESILTKEPETIEWIDGFEPGDVLWDVGANVGIYALYAALRGHRVIAFEPHFANYFQLCVNIALNGLQHRVTPLCLAVSGSKAVDTMNLSRVVFGSAMSSFGSELDFRGKPYDIVFRQGMVGCDLDSLVADFGLDPPQHVKIDVDGIELDIVRGARALLAAPALKSVSIELVDSDAAQVAGVDQVMSACGLEFVHKKQNPIYNATPTGDVLNFVYARPDPRAARIAGFVCRDEIGQLLPDGGIGAELGVAYGSFSDSLLKHSRLGFLYSIDMWAGDRGHDVAQYRAALAALMPHRHRNALLRMRFDEALSLFDDESFDFVYVDGYAHTGEEGGRTFADWWPKVKPGGIFGGHDYHPDWPLTMQEVDRFVARNGLKLYLVNEDPLDQTEFAYPSWLVFKPKTQR